RQGAYGGDAILEPEPRPGLDAQARCSRAARARRNTAYHIAWVSFPVLVFCRLGWYDPITTLPSGRSLATPCPNGGRSRGGGPRPTKHRVPHRLGELPGVGVLPTRVVRRDLDAPIGQVASDAVSERCPIARPEPIPLPRRLEPALARNAAQRHHHAHASQQAQLSGEIGTAALELEAARLVAGRRAPRGRGDIAVVERQAVVA